MDGQRNLQVARYSEGKILRTLFLATILVGALAGSAMAQAPAAGCALPSEPKDIPAAITGPADKDRACMKALFIPEARVMFVSLGADGAPSYRLEILDDWIARIKARGHSLLVEKQLKSHIERYGNIAHLWSSYALSSDGKQVPRGINSIQATKEAGGWRVRTSWRRPSRSLRRCPRNTCRKLGKLGAVKRQRSTHRNNESAFQKREALLEI